MPVDSSLPEPVVEVLHGVKVVDRYRWLEDRNSIATDAWIREQQQRHDAYFAEIPGLPWLRSHVSEFLNVKVVDQPTRVGNRYFYRRRKEDQEQACICTRDIATGDERILVNPADQGPFVSVWIHRIANDGSLLAYELRQGGSDVKAIHIVDVESSRILPDFLETGYARGFAFAHDGTGFNYCHDLPASTTPHAVRFHRFGEPIDGDMIVFHQDRTPQSRLMLISDHALLGAVYEHNNGSDTLMDLHLISRIHNHSATPVFRNKRLPYGVFFRDGQILAVTAENTPNKAIIELSPDGSPHRTIVPEWEFEIREFAPVNEFIFVLYFVNRKPIVRKWTTSGEYAGTLETTSEGSLALLPRFSDTTDSLFYLQESFTEPPRLVEYKPSTATRISWTTTRSCPIDPAIQVREVFYRSKDGTQIPMSLVMRADLHTNRAYPVILTSYGGFGVSSMPRFSVLVTLMIQLGVTFALPSIRGGSDFGRLWHEAATGKNRQVAIDDFIAASDWLCAHNITTPGKLAIFGGSNSGLLVAAAMTQRPNLFRAVLCVAPLLDMVRYEYFGSAYKWRGEYGSAEQPEDFHALHAYSPYHQVRDRVNYPSTLFVSGDKDDRCNPAHTRKMTALLQNRSAQERSIILDYSRYRGHVPALPLSIRIEALVRRVAFLCRELQVDIPLGVADESPDD